VTVLTLALVLHATDPRLPEPRFPIHPSPLRLAVHKIRIAAEFGSPWSGPVEAASLREKK